MDEPVTMRIYCEGWHENPELFLDLLQRYERPDGTTYWNAIPVHRSKYRAVAFDDDAQGRERAFTTTGKQIDFHSGERWLNEQTGEVRPGPWRKTPPVPTYLHARVSSSYQRGQDPARLDVPVRVRYEWDCDCGESVHLRAEYVWPVLDQMHAWNQTEISIQQLRRATSGRNA